MASIPQTSIYEQLGQNTLQQPVYGPFPVNTSTGGDSGGTTTNTTNTTSSSSYTEPIYSQPELEPVPSEPSIDYDAIFNPIFQALDNQKNVYTQGAATETAAAESQTNTQKQGLNTELGLRLSDLQEQENREGRKSEGMISSARRQASEILQGIGAQFGGSTHLGSAAATILGSQATQNIAANMRAYQDVVGQINVARNEIKTRVTQMINQADQELSILKQKISQGLREALATIDTEKGRLESEKAQMRTDTLMNYQNLVADINARNTDRKNRWMEQAQARLDQLNSLQSSSNSTFQGAYDAADLAKLNLTVAGAGNPADTGLATLFGLDPDTYSVIRNAAVEDPSYRPLSFDNPETFSTNTGTYPTAQTNTSPNLNTTVEQSLNLL